MPAISTILAVGGIVASGAGTAATLSASSQASDDMAKAAKKQEKAQEANIKAAKERTRIEAAESARDVKRARQRSAQTSAASANKGGTDLLAINRAQSTRSFSPPNPANLLGSLSSYGLKTTLGG